MTQSPLLIRELDRIARERGWSGARLAAFLGIDETLLVHMRAGRKRLSSDTLSKVALRFADSRTVRDLVWHYLAVEHVEKNVTDPRGDRKPVESAQEILSPDVRKRLRAYIVGFLREFYEGRGLLLTGDDAAAVRSAINYLASECAARSIRTIALNASARVTSTEGRAALSAHLVIFDRLDRASASALEVLKSRLAAVRPFVATSLVADPVTDPLLARAVMSRVHQIPVGAPLRSQLGAASHAPHA